MENIPLLGNSDLERQGPRKTSFLSFLQAFWPVSLVAFGGPQAHVALMHNRFVDVPDNYEGPKVKESTFLELFALSQSLPGPGSTQLIVALGATFGGLLGALITFIVWQLPGFIVMTLAGLWFHSHLSDPRSLLLVNTLADYAVGLISAAFAFVLVAAFKIVSKTSAPDRMKMTITLLSLFVATSIPSSAVSWIYIILLVAGGICYYIYDLLYKSSRDNDTEERDDDDWKAGISSTTGALLIAVVILVTVVIIFLPDDGIGNHIIKIFWRIGLLVFGGGIIVIPLLMTEFIESGLLPTSVFLAGFGLFGCTPGPMFNLAPFLGASVAQWKGALYGSIGLFGPGVLLQLGLLPYWEQVRRVSAVQSVLGGTNAAAVGLIIAGVWMLMKSVLVGPLAFVLTCSAGVLSAVYKVSPVRVIISHGIIGAVLVYLKIGGPYHFVENAQQIILRPS